MSTINQTIANQANAQKSTGPRTAEGKRASAANATQHGLFAKNTPVLEEDHPAFLEFSQNVHAELQPQGPTETFFVEHFIDQCWRLRACLKLETELFEWYRVYKEVKGGVGIAFAHDASQLNCFARLSKYAPLFEHRLAKDLAELRKLQARRFRPLAQGVDKTGDPGSDSGSSSPPMQHSQAELAGAPAPPEPSRPAEPIRDPQLAWLWTIQTFADQVVLSDEDPRQFNHYCQSLFAEWRPVAATKAFFVALFAATSWRLVRLSRVEAGLYEQYRFNDNVDGGFLTAFVQDAAEVDCFAKLAHYETQMRNSLSKTLLEMLR